MSTLNKIKKAVVATGLTVTTTVWLSSAALLVPSIAQAYVNDDLLKDASSSNIYVINNGVKVWVRSAAVFEGCGYSWSAVKTVSDLSSVSTADLIKKADNADVYRLEKNFKRKLASIEIFNSYSLDWNKVATVCANVLDSYSKAPLVQQTGSADIYWVKDDGLKHKMTSWESFTEHGFDIADVISINSSEMGSYSEGDAVYATPAVTCANGDGVCPSGCTSANDSDCTTPPAAGLAVALASDTPIVATVVVDTTNLNGQAFIPMLKLNFTAASNGSATVTTLKLKRNGVPSADTDFSNFYLYDGSTLLAEYTSISLGVLTFTNSAGLFIVPAGGTKAITLKVDISDSAATSRAVYWTVLDSSYVVAGTATISGTFPINGNTFTTAGVADLGTFVISNYTTYPTTIDPTGTEKELWRFDITAGNQNMKLHMLKLTMVGTIDATDIQDVRLDINGTQLGTTQQIATDKTVAFDNLAYAMLSGETKTVIVYGKVVAGTSRSFKFTIRKLIDVLATDSNYSDIYVKANSANTLAIIEPTALAGTAINAGNLTITRNADSPAGSLAKGQNTVTLAVYDFKATGEAIKVETVVVATVLSADMENLNNGKLYKVDDTGAEAQIGTTTDFDSDATAEALWVDGAADAVGAGTDDDTSFALGSTFVIPAAKTYKLKLVADTKDGGASDIGTLATDYTLTMYIGGIVATGQVSLGTITAATSTAGNQLTLSTYAPTVAENLAMADRSATNPSGVPGTGNVKIASFKITGGSVKADITAISMKDGATVAGTVSSLADICQNLKLVKNGDPLTTTIGSIYGTLTDTTASVYTFNPSPAIQVAAQTEYVIDVYCDVLTGITVADSQGTGVIYPSSISYSAGGNSGTITMSAVLQNIYLIAGGAVSVAISGDTPASAILPMGSTTTSELARFTFEETTGSEDVKISKIIVTDTSTAATDLVDISLELEGYTGTGTGPNSSFISATNGTTTFNLADNWTISAGTIKTMKVKAKTNAYGSATAGSSHVINLAAGTSTVTARGQSTVTVTVGSSIQGSTFKVYRTNLTAALASGSGGSGKTRSATDTVMKLSLTADPAYQAQLRAGSAVDDITDAVSPSGSTVGDGDWTALSASTTVAVNATTPVYGTNAIGFTQAAGPAAGQGMKYTFDAAQDWSGYSKLGFWLRSNQVADSIDFGFIDSTAGDSATTTTAVVAANTWQYVEVTLTTTAASKDGVTLFIIDAATALAVADTVDIDNLRLYNDSINLDVSGALNATVAESGGVAWSLRDASGITKASGYYSGTATAGTVKLVPDSLITIGSSGSTYSVVTNSNENYMVKDVAAGISQSMSVSVDRGTASAAGDFRWYDGAVAATSPVTWVTAAESTLTSTNTYAAGA